LSNFELPWRCYNGPTYELTIVASDMIREPYTLPMFYTVPNDYIILRHIYNCVCINFFKLYQNTESMLLIEGKSGMSFCGGQGFVEGPQKLISKASI
jgi:hypothetical protein